MKRTTLIELSRVSRTYQESAHSVIALHELNLTVEPGEFLAVVGQSGSGKSTLLNLIGGLDRPTAGEVIVDGNPLQQMSEDQLARWRSRHVGIVFQFYQLLPTLTLLENVIFPMELGPVRGWTARRNRALDLLDQVGLAERADAFPAQVSGGEQQRVAIARSLANDPPLLLADEPTGNLDSATSESIFQLFCRFVDQGHTLVLVTHEERYAEQASRMVRLVDGRRVMADG